MRVAGRVEQFGKVNIGSGIKGGYDEIRCGVQECLLGRKPAGEIGQ